MARQHKTSADLAAVLSVSQSSASRRMNGQSPVDLNEVEQVSVWLGIPVMDLLSHKAMAA